MIRLITVRAEQRKKNNFLNKKQRKKKHQVMPQQYAMLFTFRGNEMRNKKFMLYSINNS